MKILSLGLDNSILDKNSHLAGRVVDYGNIVDKYDVVVPGGKSEPINFSDKVTVYSVGGAVKLVKLIRLYKLAKKLLEKEKYGVVTVQDQYYLGFIGLCLARKFKIGLDVQVHGFEKYWGLRKLLAKYVMPRADAIRAVSQKLKEKLVSEFGVTDDKITVVPIFTDFRFQISDFRFKKDDKDKFVFLTIGRLVEIKNVGRQIRALKNTEFRMKNIELWIVGSGSEENNLKKEIKNLGLEGRVKMLGRQDDLDKFYRRADVFLLTSQSEGWGLVVIEAASFGLPIIMTDVGCAGEVIKDGESGLVTPVGGQKELEEAMVKLIKDAGLRKKLGVGARRAVEKLPGREETLRLYKESWKKARDNAKLAD